MKPRKYTNTHRLILKYLCALVSLWLIILTGCNEIRSPKPDVFIGKPAPPQKREFRWSNGKTPKSLDPALASASPETDIVRALYEGLTDLDTKKLEPVPAIAVKWSSSEDFKIWTFQLRTDAKWSNGEPLTAQDFVRSWKRLAELGDKVSQRDLVKNIVGMDTENALPVFANPDEDVFAKESEALENTHNENSNTVSNTNTSGNSEQKTQEVPKAKETPKPETKKPNLKPIKRKKLPTNFGVEAVKSNVLKVTLEQSDENFPALVAHPIFRPVYGEGEEFETSGLPNNLVTNGAFHLVSIGKDGIALERSENYWNKNEIGLERIRFVPKENAESALAAYRAGEIDVVTNANFAPLALKLLTPFDEFRRTKHSALNFYEFNLYQKPFDDHRVREALAIAIVRERLTEDEMDGATEPALNFLPFNEDFKLAQNVEKAKKLLADAGFPNGEKFPTIHLVINRNDLQKRIARSVAKMWKKTLNIDTEVVVKEPDDFQAALQNSEFDIIRRGIVMPTADETANMMAMFEPRVVPPDKVKEIISDTKNNDPSQILTDKTAESKLNLNEPENSTQAKNEPNVQTTTTIDNAPLMILNEEQAMDILPAIPLYFPSSYSLVKPYIQGFDSNALDAPSLKNVKIDNNWQPSNQKTLSNP